MKNRREPRLFIVKLLRGIFWIELHFKVE